jgi:hypothetical protein
MDPDEHGKAKELAEKKVAMYRKLRELRAARRKRRKDPAKTGTTTEQL